MEALIRALPQLEVKLEKASGVTQFDHKHVTAHGYVSSEPNDVGQLPKYVASSNSSEWTSSSSNILNQTKKYKQPEEGFHSESSHQLSTYLKQLRHAQLLLICHRVIIL